ncbi:DUF4041 domain-containing protein [Sansalvadorimonas verongulae]|uniref:DUF4041 domain-containing protein n=1 Tax=Sansalvadorimonas verongulae TaxID=2172824 RepID=UPI0012BB8F07|nr:DUF4041 domain-containing protein [Sansalvadorimonas verongulae]MTI12176.1 DUF4041 domain-containing protein [Sansalvadorimonas verongulae]
MEPTMIAAAVAAATISAVLTFFITSKQADKKIKEYSSLSGAIKSKQSELETLQIEAKKAEDYFKKTDADTKELQKLKKHADQIEDSLEEGKKQYQKLTTDLDAIKVSHEAESVALDALLADLDLYSRIDGLTSHGHFERPEYLYETSERFAEEIKQIRQEQKELIKVKEAVTYPEDIVISENKSYNKKILEGQVRLMLSAFNIECDLLIGKVKPSSYVRTLERIEKLANTLEKSAASLKCGFNIRYVELKFQECTLQYQHALKKQEEQEEQRLIREQIREEQKAIKEYERAVAQAEKEERMYRDMLARAREELSQVSEKERAVAEQRIADLEQQLADAEAKEERAKSMAEQTRKGHVYVISNIGSFGENVYKIGLTRRLEPMDRVKELGDASVPFSFDVHAMVYVDDAPALESALHREFTESRVNAVNMRKEFFHVDLHDIRQAVERIAGIDTEFKMTALAEEYYETRRLQKVDVAAA